MVLFGAAKLRLSVIPKNLEGKKYFEEREILGRGHKRVVDEQKLRESKNNIKNNFGV